MLKEEFCKQIPPTVIYSVIFTVQFQKWSIISESCIGLVTQHLFRSPQAHLQQCNQPLRSLSLLCFAIEVGGAQWVFEAMLADCTSGLVLGLLRFYFFLFPTIKLMQGHQSTKHHK